MDEDPFLRWRQEFAILERTVYLVSHSLGAMPRGVEESLRRYAEEWATRGVDAWSDVWWQKNEEVGNLLGRLVNAPPGSISMHQNATIASAVVLSSLDFEPPRAKIVMTELDFPSIIYLHRRFPPPTALLEIVPSPDGITIDQDRLLEAIDQQTRLVAVSHVLFKSAYVQDAAAIVERAHEVGALVCLDAYQSVGALPVDFAALGVDFAVGGCHKWLCGGAGGGYLYVRPELAERLEPRFTGWFAHARPFDFAPRQKYADGPRRFLSGTTALPSLYAVQPGLELVERLDLEALRSKSLRLTGRMIELADERGWAVRSPRRASERGGTVTVDVPGGKAVEEALVRRGYMVDYRPEAGIRMSPHFYTAEEEVEALFAELDRIVAERVTVQ